ncbi:hypothetical protein D3C74_372550 [compost metagenome]
MRATACLRLSWRAGGRRHAEAEDKLSEEDRIMSDEDRKLAIRYAPCLWFDRNEPFFPARFGVTVLREDGESPSFRRSLNVSRPKVKAIVEYAIYYDYDIQQSRTYPQGAGPAVDKYTRSSYDTRNDS